jgi:1,4-dihydroxy-2-naphthoate octaprenyltransferase
MHSTQAAAMARPPLWRVWLQAARPATLLAAVVPVAVASSLARQGGALQWGVVWAALGGAMALQIGTNLFNDYADARRGADTAARLGPARVTQMGWLRPATVLWATAAAFAAATACGFFLLAFGGWTVVAVGLCSIAAGLAYTGGPYPLGYHGLGDVFVFIFFGLVAVCTTYLLQVGSISPPCWLAASAVGTWAAAILVVNNLRDRHTDLPAGKRTLAVRFGAGFARRQYAGLVAWPCVVCVALAAWQVQAGLGGAHRWAPLLPCLCAPLAFANVQAVYRRDGRALNALLGRTALAEALWGLLFVIGVSL